MVTPGLGAVPPERLPGVFKEASALRVRSFGLRPQDDIQEALSPLRVTLSVAKSLHRPGREQNDRPVFSTKAPHYHARSALPAKAPPDEHCTAHG